MHAAVYVVSLLQQDVADIITSLSRLHNTSVMKRALRRISGHCSHHPHLDLEMAANFKIQLTSATFVINVPIYSAKYRGINFHYM